MKFRWMGVRRNPVPLAALVVIVGIPSMAMASSERVDRTDAARKAIVGGHARNVILLIGDGMGDSEITIARNYEVGAAGRLAMDRLPLTGAYTTYSVEKSDPTKPDYTPDSASAATAFSTGHKSYDGAISVTPDERPQPTVLELAKRAGLRTGDVSTAELQDATPAAAASHVPNRYCRGPQSMTLCPASSKENGGPGSISEQLIETKPDVLLGGGMRYFNQTVQAGPYQGKTVLEQARASGYRIVTDGQALAAATPDAPLLGLFADSDLDREWTGPVPVRENTAPAACAPNADRAAGQPHLVDMTRKAIELLSRQTEGKKRGFFLQIEGAAIDKAAHTADPCGQIGETVGFDAAVAEALRYQRRHPDTLVVVTADHGHSSQIVEAGSVTSGLTATVRTREGADMTVNYSTAPAPGWEQQHTGSQVRIAAGGPQAANVLGITDQTEVFVNLRRALGI